MRNGTTYRKRNSKSKSPRNVPLDHNTEIITLTRWIKRNGFIINKKMNIAEFTDTGRGIMAKEKIRVGDVLMEVPFCMIFNLITLEFDTDFKNIFFCPKREINVKFRCQELLAFYLTYLKINEASLFWQHYIDSLPKTLTVPYFANISAIKNLDDRIYEIVDNQKNIIRDSYDKFDTVLETSQYNNDFKNKFTLALYEWSYFIINSRCVYLNPEIVKNIYKSINNYDEENAFLNILIDDPNLGLIPYLDMFNHSYEAKTSSELSTANNKTGVTFKLISLSECNRFDQIFISYGDHCNLKLLTEYGFCLPRNPLTRVQLVFNEICNLLQNDAIPAEKYKYIQKHKLNEDIDVSLNGYNYNFLRLLYVITSDDKCSWNSKIYSNDFNAMEYEKMYETGVLLLKDRMTYFSKKISKFQSQNLDNDTFDIAKSLVDEYVSILLHCIEKYT